MRKFCYIILHYKNLTDTLACIQSIKKNCSKSSKIIVVDNCTLDKKSEEKLKKYHIDLILLDKNMGFANGNNKGCQYAIKKYHPDYLVVINNDILINQQDFETRITAIDEEKNFDLLGPKIITEQGESVNPFPAYSTLKEVTRNLNKTKMLIRIYQSFILRFLLEKYIKLKRKFISPIPLKNGEVFQEGVALHGCAVIFSRKYYLRYEDIFYNGTFLYHEEEFLLYRINQDHLISCYSPDIEVFHQEGASLDKSFSGKYSKLIFKNQEIVKSLTKLQEIMKSKQRI